jgi:hypothetical protein
MTPVVFGVIVVLANVIVACGIGATVGLLSALVFGGPRSMRTVGMDAALAAFAFVIGAFLLSAIATASGVLSTGVQWLFLISACSVLMKHLFIAFRHSRHGRGSAEQ